MPADTLLPNHLIVHLCSQGQLVRLPGGLNSGKRPIGGGGLSGFLFLSYMALGTELGFSAGGDTGGNFPLNSTQEPPFGHL